MRSFLDILNEQEAQLRDARDRKDLEVCEAAAEQYSQIINGALNSKDSVQSREILRHRLHVLVERLTTSLGSSVKWEVTVDTLAPGDLVADVFPSVLIDRKDVVIESLPLNMVGDRPLAQWRGEVAGLGLRAEGVHPLAVLDRLGWLAELARKR